MEPQKSRYKEPEFFPPNPNWDQTRDWMLEIGPGNGAFFVDQAQKNPQKQWIAIEIRKGRFEKISRKIDRLKLENLTVIWGEAKQVLSAFFKPSSLNEIFVLFPDPWPKRRHHKHRLLQQDFTDFLHTLLKPAGKIWVATDHPEYATQILEVFPEQKWWIKPSDSLYPTYFETKWKSLGFKIHYFCWEKIIQTIESTKSTI